MVLATILIPLMFGSPQDPRATIQPSFTAPLVAEVPASPTPVKVARVTVPPMPSEPAAIPAVPVTAPPLPTPEPTQLPTATPRPTPTAARLPTPRATPTATPRPTATPTATPRPTATPPSEPPPRAQPLAPPAETPAGDSDHRWTVQVASYKNEAPAERLRAQLRDAGYDSFIVSKLINGTRYYRVRVYVVGNEDRVVAVQGRIEKRYRVSTRRYY